MKALRKAVAGVVLGIGLSAAWIVGGSLVKDVQFARAEQQVEASRQQIASVQDLASVYKAVGKAVEPSVVSIDITKTIKNPHNNDMLRKFFRDRNGDGQPDMPDGFQMPDTPDEFQAQGTGSGVIMEVDGSTAYICTNNHVAGGATEMDVTLWDGRVIKGAKLVGADPKSDVAVIKIQADHLIPAKWGDSDKLEKGDIVMAFGSPLGYVGSMTHGIISALHRQAGVISGQFAYENFIQTDAPINPGNSGGPLVDLQGNVVGINTAIATRSGGFQGIGFAVPANQAKYVYDALKTKGKVVRGWLGVEIADVAKLHDEAAAVGYKGDQGILVKGSLKNTPASGKLQPGDVITSINSKKVGTVQELRNQIAATAPGTEVTLGVFRDSKDADVKIKLGEQPESDEDMLASRAGGSGNADRNPQLSAETLGLRLAAPSDDLEQRFNLDQGTQGAVVTSVRAGSPGAMVGLRAGDVITRIDNKPIASPEDVSSALAKKDLAKGVKLMVSNRDGSRFVFIKSSGKNQPQSDDGGDNSNGQ